MVVRTFLLVFTVLVRLDSQPASTNVLLAPDSDDLYLIFLQMHARSSDSLDLAKSRNPTIASALDDHTAKTYGIQIAEIARLAARTRAATVELRGIDDQETKYRNRMAAWEQPPHRTALSRFSEQRFAVARRTMQEIRKEMSPAGWAGLQRYVNLVLRGTIRSSAAAPNK